MQQTATDVDQVKVATQRTAVDIDQVKRLSSNSSIPTAVPYTSFREANARNRSQMALRTGPLNES